jgi:integrase
MPKRRHFGSVRKRASGRWQATYWHEGRLHSSGTFQAKADALAYLSTVEADVRRGAWIDPRSGQITLEAFSLEWLERRTDLAIRTRELYEHLLGKHILPPLGRATLAGLAPSKVRGWYSELTSRHPSTASKSYRLLSQIMGTAVTDGLILATPCRIRGASTEHAAERPTATVEEVCHLAAAMPLSLKAAVLLGTWCQLRRGEVLGLRRQDINLLHATLRVEQTRIFTRNGAPIIKPPKTDAGRRTLSVPVSMTDALSQHLEQFTDAGPDALLFGSVSAASFQRAWDKARTGIGRTDLHFHDLRHTGLTLAAATGATTAELMHRAGHSSPDAALRYQHATQDRDKVLANALAALVTPTEISTLKFEAR